MWTSCLVGVNGTILVEEHEGVLWRLGYYCVKAPRPKGLWSRAAKGPRFHNLSTRWRRSALLSSNFSVGERSSRFPLFKRLAELGAECQDAYIEMQITEKSVSLCVFASPLNPYVKCEVSLFAVTRNCSSVSGLNFYYRIIHPCLN
jgi:hypothetical protein